MIEILDLRDDAIAGLRIDGGVEKSDIERAYQSFGRQLKSGKTLRFYAEVANFGLRDMTPEAMLADTKAWLTTVFEIECALIPTLTGEVFASGEKDTALAWLQGEEPGAKLSELSAPDLSLAQLMQFATVKAAGGFALGLLAANLLKKKQRRQLGWSLLLGACALGVPLALSVFSRKEEREK